MIPRKGRYVCGGLGSLWAHAGCGARNDHDTLICCHPSLPLLTPGVKRAGPVFLLGEAEGSQGRNFSVFELKPSPDADCNGSGLTVIYLGGCCVITKPVGAATGSGPGGLG
jgi:hypothetical protein